MNRPLKPPASALAEGIQRYAMPRLGIRLPAAETPPTTTSQASDPIRHTDPRVQRDLADLRSFLQLARASPSRVVAVQFADHKEAESGTLQPGIAWIGHTLQSEGIPSVQAGPIFRACGPIASLYCDSIHPYNAAGQDCLARAIQQVMALDKF